MTGNNTDSRTGTKRGQLETKKPVSRLVLYKSQFLNLMIFNVYLVGRAGLEPATKGL